MVSTSSGADRRWRSRWRSTTHNVTTNLTTTHTNANLVIATATHQLTNTKQNMSDALWVESNVFQNDIEVSLNETAATKALVTKAPRSRWVIPGDIIFDFRCWVMPEATTTHARPIAHRPHTQLLVAEIQLLIDVTRTTYYKRRCQTYYQGHWDKLPRRSAKERYCYIDSSHA